MHTKSFSLTALIMAITFALSIVISSPTQAQPDAAANQTKANKGEAMSIVKKFGGTLKPQLKKAIKSGGPVKAIDVCSVQAPAIAEQLSKETGWTVKRVSLKARNKSAATPDAWETKVLQQFEARQAKGEDPKTMAYSETIDGKFRFMKAQAIAPVCLNCHGETLAEPVQKALKQHYPDDMATGYTLGQIRGAFSLTKNAD